MQNVHYNGLDILKRIIKCKKRWGGQGRDEGLILATGFNLKRRMKTLP